MDTRRSSMQMHCYGLKAINNHVWLTDSDRYPFSKFLNHLRDKRVHRVFMLTDTCRESRTKHKLCPRRNDVRPIVKRMAAFNWNLNSPNTIRAVSTETRQWNMHAFYARCNLTSWSSNQLLKLITCRGRTCNLLLAVHW